MPPNAKSKGVGVSKMRGLVTLAMNSCAHGQPTRFSSIFYPLSPYTGEPGLLLAG